MKDTIDKPRPRQKEKNPPAAAELSDPWRDWQPQWQLRASDDSLRQNAAPHDVQERHSPTEATQLRNGKGTNTPDTSCRRRIVDARLWESFDDLQQQAALEIAQSFARLSRGLGFASSDWQRLPGARQASGSDGHAVLAGPYIDWTKACQREKVSHSMAIDILCFGISCRRLDRDRRVRTGTARQNLLQALTLYTKIRGWRRC